MQPAAQRTIAPTSAGRRSGVLLPWGYCYHEDVDASSDLSPALRVGVISDTHGRLDPVVLQLFEGVDHIIHAGDVGSMAVLDGLQAVAPVTAVRGNVDRDRWACDLPDETLLRLGGSRILVRHVKEEVLRLHDPVTEGLAVVIVGHSHAPAIDWRDGVLYLNPGSAGNRRFHLPRAVAFLEIGPDGVEPEIAILEEGSGTAR